MYDSTDRTARHRAHVRERRRARRELEQFVRRLGILLIALLLLMIAGTVGYALLEHTSGAYGFEWTVDTIATVGGIPDPPDTGGWA